LKREIYCKLINWLFWGNENSKFQFNETCEDIFLSCNFNSIIIILRFLNDENLPFKRVMSEFKRVCDIVATGDVLNKCKEKENALLNSAFKWGERSFHLI
jgi:hypothetical protein